MLFLFYQAYRAFWSRCRMRRLRRRLAQPRDETIFWHESRTKRWQISWLIRWFFFSSSNWSSNECIILLLLWLENSTFQLFSVRLPVWPSKQKHQAVASFYWDPWVIVAVLAVGPNGFRVLFGVDSKRWVLLMIRDFQTLTVHLELVGTVGQIERRLTGNTGLCARIPNNYGAGTVFGGVRIGCVPAGKIREKRLVQPENDGNRLKFECQA